MESARIDRSAVGRDATLGMGSGLECVVSPVAERSPVHPRMVSTQLRRSRRIPRQFDAFADEGLRVQQASAANVPRSGRAICCSPPVPGQRQLQYAVADLLPNAAGIV